MAKRKTKQTKANLSATVAKYLKAKKAGRDGYQRADRILQEIAHQVTPGKEFAINESGRKAKLVDRFGAANIVWTPCAARRYDLEIIEP